MIRQPIQNLYAKTVTATASSSDTFSLSKVTDYDAIVAKLVVATLTAGGGGQTLNVYVQTSDDGGTTYYDNVAFGTVTGVVTTQAALFAVIPVNSGDSEYISNITASATGGYVGSANGLPALSSLFRVVWSYAGVTATSVATWNLTLFAQNQSPHA